MRPARVAARTTGRALVVLAACLTGAAGCTLPAGTSVDVTLLTGPDTSANTSSSVPAAPTDPPSPRAAPTDTSTPAPSPGAAPRDALGVLSTLVVARPHDGAPAYARGHWEHWLDEDADGCDAREEVLLAEALEVPAIADDCSLGTGRWRSIYDGVAVTDPGDLDVDHVVPLLEAHRSGGWAWDAPTRAAYANDLGDPRALVAVTAATNRAKGDRDPAGWLPADGVCEYVSDWVAVKEHWGLSVDAEEATALSDLLLGPCAGATVAPWAGGRRDDAADATDRAPSCQPGYTPCLPAGADIDCGDLAALGVEPPIAVTGPDPYGLDADGDGLACGP